METPTWFAARFEPPYYAVIFSSLKRSGDPEYETAAQRMEELARVMPGCLGIESARDRNGFGITVSYWSDEASIASWRRHGEHVLAQERGKRDWYAHYEIRIARVERSHAGP